MNPADIVERLRECQFDYSGRGDLIREAAMEIEQLREELDVNRTALEMKHAEIDRLRELFRKDGEDHAAHVRGLVEQHETRMTRYADEIDRLRAQIEEYKSDHEHIKKRFVGEVLT